MALYLDGRKVLPICDSASDTTFDDTNVAYEADDVQEALEKVTKSLTYAEYEALTDAEKNNGTIYLITDVNGDGQSFQPVIYSTEEREIGVWTDGKPLYEKTFKVDNTSIDTSHETEIADLTTLNVETFVGVVNSVGYFRVYDVTINENRLSIGYKPTTKKLIAGQSYTQQYTAVDIITTIRYTKTTDTAGSGTWTPQGVPAHHYSTDEQVVGTWTDGSTLYQKTYSYSISSETSQEIATLDSNIIVKEIKGIIHNNGVDMNIPWIDASFFYNIYITSAHKLTAIKRNTGDWTSQPVEITLRYTKSST